MCYSDFLFLFRLRSVYLSWLEIGRLLRFFYPFRIEKRTHETYRLTRPLMNLRLFSSVQGYAHSLFLFENLDFTQRTKVILYVKLKLQITHLDVLCCVDIIPCLFLEIDFFG